VGVGPSSATRMEEPLKEFGREAYEEEGWRVFGGLVLRETAGQARLGEALKIARFGGKDSRRLKGEGRKSQPGHGEGAVDSVTLREGRRGLAGRALKENALCGRRLLKVKKVVSGGRF